MRVVLSFLFASVAAVAGAAHPVSVTAVGEDVYRIEIGGPPPASDEAARGARGQSTWLELAPDGAAVRITVRDIQLTADALTAEIRAPRFSGGIRMIEKFGRAAVDGLELAWSAAPDEAVYGLGERFDGLSQRGRRVEMWIKDSPGGGGEQADTYFCAPVVFSSRGYALWRDENPEGEFDLAATDPNLHVYRAAGTRATFHLAFGRSVDDLVRARTKVRGSIRPIPEWALGLWMSKNSYETQQEATDAIDSMTRRGWPVAAIVQEAWKGDSQAGGFNNFSAERWPSLDDYFALCRKHDIKTILWQVPVLHPSSPDFADAARRGSFVKDPSGGVSLREQWLAGFANIDFTNPDAVKFWKDQMRDELRRGVWGFKADDGEDIRAGDVFSDGRRGWELHNEYSILYNRVLWELLDEEKIDGILWARSGSVGIERTPALWAGDQFATWPQMRCLVGAGLSAGLSGMPFWSHDIGGFIGTPTPELYIRWFQFGTFSPLMQFHGNTAREPWRFGPDAERICGELIHLRMILKPTLAALAREAAETGVPMMRPMAMVFPDDSRFTGEDSQYMLGPDLLVAPVFEDGARARLVRFPVGLWHDLRQRVAYEGPSARIVPCPLDAPPVFVRDGARLTVALPEGVTLTDDALEWRPDAPTRELTFSADRAVIRNLAAPAFAGALSGRAAISFEAPEGDAFELRVTRAAGDAADERVEMTRDGRTIRATIRRPPGESLAGLENGFEIVRSSEVSAGGPASGRSSSAGGPASGRSSSSGEPPTDRSQPRADPAGERPAGGRSPSAAAGGRFPSAASGGRSPSAAAGGGSQILYRGSVRWIMPLTLRVIDDPSWVLDDGERSVVTEVTNCTDEPAEFLLSASIDPTGILDEPERGATAPPRSTTRWTWPVTIRSGALLDSIRVRFELMVGDIELADQTAVFARPFQWVVCGPFFVKGGSPYAATFGPEWAWGADAAFASGDGRTLQWQRVDPKHALENNGLDFNKLFGPRTHAAAYALTRIKSKTEQDAELHFGSDDTLTVWLNGERVLTEEAYRAAARDQNMVPVRLRAGENTIVVKVAQSAGGWQLLARISGPYQRPIEGVSNAFENIAAYDPNRAPAGDVVSRGSPLAWRLAGPFENRERNNIDWRGPLDPPTDAGPNWQPPADARWVDWKAPANVDGTVDLVAALGRQSHAVAYAHAILRSDRERSVELVIGSDDGVEVWLNGKSVLRDAAWREFHADAHRVRAMLRAGENHLFVKVGQGTANWKFRVEVWDLSLSPPRPLGAGASAGARP